MRCNQEEWLVCDCYSLTAAGQMPAARTEQERKGDRTFIDFQYYSVAAKDETRLSVNKRIPGVYTVCACHVCREKRRSRVAASSVIRRIVVHIEINIRELRMDRS